MRNLLLLSMFTTSLAHAGDGLLGTKQSTTAGGVPAEVGGIGAMPFIQMALALGVVLLLLKFVMPKLVTKLNKKIVTKDGSAIHIEESAAFAGGSLYIVRAKGKTLLLSASATGVTCLADLGEAPVQNQPTFQELVEKEQAGPLQPFAVVEAAIPELLDEPKPSKMGKAKRVLDVDDIGSNRRQAAHAIPEADAAAILERLNRLAG